jgi:hypothetical protein
VPASRRAAPAPLALTRSSASPLRYTQGGLTVATYEAWQRHADGTVTGRLSTVVFRDQAGTPNGLVWAHVHETWLPEAVQQRRPRQYPVRRR